MQIPIPTDVKPGYREDSVRLCFGENKDRCLEYHCRGVISWPKTGVSGLALISGLDISTGVVSIFEEFLFDDIKDFESDVANVPLKKGGRHFFNEWWNRYHCNEYYVESLEVINRQYWNQITDFYEAGFLSNEPDIIRVRLSEEKLRREHIRHWLKTRRVQGDPRHIPFIVNHLDLMSKVPDTEELTGVKVVSLLLASFEQQPYEMPDPYDYQEVWFQGDAF